MKPKPEEMRGQAPNKPLRATAEATYNSQRPHRKVRFAGDVAATFTYKISKPMRAYNYKGTDDRHLRRELRLAPKGIPQQGEETFRKAPVDVAQAESAARQRATPLQHEVFPASPPDIEAEGITLAPLRRPPAIWLPKPALSSRDRSSFLWAQRMPVRFRS